MKKSIIQIGNKKYRLDIANTFSSRFFGLMGRKSIPEDYALAIVPCNSIHTFFMRFNIDAIFFDKDGKITKVVRNMKPWHMAMSLSAYGVLEIISSSNGDIDVHVGDRMIFL